MSDALTPEEINPEEETLVMSLQYMGEIINMSKGRAVVTMLDGRLFIEAAEKIKKLFELGDQLANISETQNWSMAEEAVANWKAERNA